MSDIAENLLAQYYGLSKKSETEKFVSIHDCVNNAENDIEKLIGEQSTVDTNDNDTSGETEMQGDIEDENKNAEIDIPVRSSRALEWETLEDDEKTSSGFDIIFEANIANNLCENTSISSGKETQDLILHNTKTTTLDPEDNEGNDLYLSFSEDAMPDSASDVSSITGTKKMKKSPDMYVSSTPPLNKSLIYNETFVDLTSAGLTSLPIEVIEKYSTIQMLYLENNNLSELPEELFVSLPYLQWLDVRNNQLTNLPASIRSHPSLESILLQGNKIEKLPLELCLVPKLKILNIAHNPIITPPKDIIALGCSGILNYLRTEWNKLHPDEPVASVEQKIEPKLSTILCYQFPHEKRRKLSKISQRASKSTNDIDASFKGISVRKRSRAYKPSNRYINSQINTFLENPINDTRVDDAMSSLCASCARNLADIQYKNENNTKKNESDDNQHKRHDQHALLKMITSCHDVSKICIKREIAEVDAKILHLIGPSPRSCYIRRNVTGLITYKRYPGKECRIQTISNETKHITLGKSRNSEVFNEEKKKSRNIKHAELVFDIVTKDMQRMQLHPMQLKDSHCILSCLENYLGIKTD